MKKPIAIYKFKQTLQAKGNDKGQQYKGFVGCYEKISNTGDDFSQLSNDVTSGVNKGKSIISVGKNKGGLVLHCNAMKKPPYNYSTPYISNLEGTDIEDPYIKRYYGDIYHVYNTILVQLEEIPETKERYLAILICEDGKDSKEDLYRIWLADQMKISTSDNNIGFSTDFVQTGVRQ